MAAHFCVRVYANGDAKYTIRDGEGLASWLSHNRSWRPGNALFVDGRLPEPDKPDRDDKGYLNDEQIAHVSAILLTEMKSMDALTPWQRKYDAEEKAHIYPERDRASFKLPRKPEPQVEDVGSPGLG